VQLLCSCLLRNLLAGSQGGLIAGLGLVICGLAIGSLILFFNVARRCCLTLADLSFTACSEFSIHIFIFRQMSPISINNLHHIFSQRMILINFNSSVCSFQSQYTEFLVAQNFQKNISFDQTDQFR